LSWPIFKLIELQGTPSGEPFCGASQ